MGLRPSGLVVPDYLLDQPLFTDKFSTPSWVNATTNGVVGTITPNLPADAVVKRATLHMSLGAYNCWPTGDVQLSGQTIYSLGSHPHGPNATSAYDYIKVPVPANLVVPNGANNISLANLNVGATGVMQILGLWLEIGYHLRGNILSQLRRGRWGLDYAQAYGITQQITGVASGDICTWSQAIAVPAGMKIRNAILQCSVQTYYDTNGGGTNVALNAGKMYVQGPGEGGFTARGQDVATCNLSLYYLQSGSHEMHTNGNPILTIDGRPFMTQEGTLTAKWNGLKFNAVSDYADMSVHWSAWVSYSPDPAA